MAFATVIKCELLTKSQTGEASKNLNKQTFSSDVQELGEIMQDYVKDILNRDTINISPGILLERKSMDQTRRQQRKASDAISLMTQLRQFTNDHVLKVNLARATTETGRLFFFKG